MKTLGIAAALAAAAVAATPAAAQAPDLRWEPYHAEETVDFPAGDTCRFALRSTVTFDREYVRTTRTYADGSPRRQVFSGPLVVRLTNRATGRSVQRDLSAYATATYARNGAVTLTSHGPIGVGFHAGDDLPPGYYVLRGFHRIHIDTDGNKRVLADRGSEEDVCDALSGGGAASAPRG